MQFHPLTAEAAATLLQQPKLGRDVAGAFRSTRSAASVGQRFYYLEIAGAHPSPFRLPAAHKAPDAGRAR